jgi:hypothetical protein
MWALWNLIREVQESFRRRGSLKLDKSGQKQCGLKLIEPNTFTI